ncbi:unnamed protein product [Adineta steineri]|uniref:Glycolipid transfer protein domain-containing protein n=1 Tax=Adineta steineri TaxID=433720 RepID=A0A814RMI6_9BILA|nr:unnamed protein product [Adineta steineri]CAF1068987.1 unnamed protein product [Adineta steineri]CAF1134577.1 unnamed protein product [Adineta steineri]
MSNIVENKTRDHQSTGIIKSNINSANNFDVQRVYETFFAALREPDNPKSPIGTQDYMNGYRELLKFVDQLGYVFKFVKDDVIDKLGILQAFVDTDRKKGTSHYDTIQHAIDYETEQNIIKTNPDNNFTRTLLRLHRALIFIVQLLQGLNDRPLSESTSTIASTCYKATLYNHHGFMVRGTVKVGFHMLPSRKELDDAIFHGHKTELLEQYMTFVKIIKQIYDTVEAYYAEKNYLQLP